MKYKVITFLQSNVGDTGVSNQVLYVLVLETHPIQYETLVTHKAVIYRK